MQKKKVKAPDHTFPLVDRWFPFSFFLLLYYYGIEWSWVASIVYDLKFLQSTYLYGHKQSTKRKKQNLLGTGSFSWHTATSMWQESKASKMSFQQNPFSLATVESSHITIEVGGKVPAPCLQARPKPGLLSARDRDFLPHYVILKP